jgi:hypothetical protein
MLSYTFFSHLHNILSTCVLLMISIVETQLLQCKHRPMDGYIVMFNILTDTCCIYNIVPDCLGVCLCYRILQSQLILKVLGC